MDDWDSGEGKSFSNSSTERPRWFGRILATNTQTKSQRNTIEKQDFESTLVTALALTKQTNKRNLVAATAALTLATASLAVAPLKLATLPLFIYMGLPAARQVYKSIREEDALPATLEVAAIGLVLAQGAVLPGAIGLSLYYWGRTWWSVRKEKAAQSASTSFLPTTVCVRRPIGDVLVPVAQVQPSEQVLYAAGDLIAVGGVVLDGVAWLQNSQDVSCNAAHSPTVVKPSAQVAVGDLVLAGSLVVESR